MIEHDDKLVKILFKFYSEVLDQWTVETMWAETVDENKGLYKIDNIPFYASVASDDIVYAQYDETEKMLTYQETIECSGNSLVQVVITEESVTTNSVRDIFNSMDCKSEKVQEGYFVMEVLADRDYKTIRQKLMELQEKGMIDYAEPVLSSLHQY